MKFISTVHMDMQLRTDSISFRAHPAMAMHWGSHRPAGISDLVLRVASAPATSTTVSRWTRNHRLIPC